MDRKEQILATLKKLGPSSPVRIADKIGMQSSTCGLHLRALVKEGKVKGNGAKRSNLYALPDQEFDGGKSTTPPLRRKKARKSTKRKAHRRTARKAVAAEEFIPGLTAGGGLLIVGHTPAPLMFTPVQAEKLADLLFKHYEA